MTITQRINMAIAYKGVTQAEIARKLGLSPSNFGQRIKRGNFSVAELEKIAEALDAEFLCAFRFEDGTKV